MGSMKGKAAFRGRLQTRHIKAPQNHAAWSIRLPGGRRVYLTDDPGGSFLARTFFSTHLEALHRGADGGLIAAYDCGSGLVTNVGVMSMANDANWAAPSGESQSTLALARWHAAGTGTGAESASQVALEALAAPTTANAVEGTHVLVSEENAQKYRSIATINYTEALAITEWGLFTGKVLSATTGTPFTAVSATEATVTASPLTASSATVAGTGQGHIIKAGTTASWAMPTSNTTSVFKFPAWVTTSNGKEPGVTPGATEAFTILPIMWDRKKFAAINVVSGDSIEFKYTLEVKSGG